jgi:ATP-dependent Lhr-like helicase
VGNTKISNFIASNIMTNVFSSLDPKIQEFLSLKNIKTPTEPQIKSMPFIINGENVLLIAPTGLGKTESALLPIFHNFIKEKKSEENGISILYITPLRALDEQLSLGKALVSAFQ